MIKTLQQALKMDREKFKVPRSVQQAIPIQRIWPDGVFQSGTKFSKSFRFSDINYAIASKEDKTEMFLDYSELLNALDSGACGTHENCKSCPVRASIERCFREKNSPQQVDCLCSHKPILLLFDYSLRLAPSHTGGCRSFIDPLYLHCSE